MSLIGSWYDEKKFKLALPRENGNLPFLMMMYVVIMEGFVDVSTAHYDKDSNIGFLIRIWPNLIL